MEKIDLHELGKMTKTFRACHRALKRLKEDGEDFELSFVGTYRRHGGTIPIIDQDALRNYIVAALNGELSMLRKRFAGMGLTLSDIDKRKTKKAPLKVAK